MPSDRVNSAAAAVVVTLLLICGSGPGNAADATSSPQFITGADDLPLMPGLKETPGRSMVFDKPGGRIVEAQASGSMAWPQVVTFYSSTLPQLGWVGTENVEHGLRFQRDDEILTIQLDGNDGGDALIGFRIAPRPVPSADTEK